MENLSIKALAKEIVKLNPNASFKVQDYTTSPVERIYGTIPGENLVLPDGYYYNQKNGVTNKYNAVGGIYVSYEYIFRPI